MIKAAVKRIPELQDENWKFVFEYDCICSAEMILYSQEQPKILARCWNCCHEIKR